MYADMGYSLDWEGSIEDHLDDYLAGREQLWAIREGEADVI